MKSIIALIVITMFSGIFALGSDKKEKKRRQFVKENSKHIEGGFFTGN